MRIIGPPLPIMPGSVKKEIPKSGLLRGDIFDFFPFPLKSQFVTSSLHFLRSQIGT